jgi:hypothetical protein
MRPSLHLLRLYGPKNGLVMDELQQTVLRVRGSRYKSYLEQFVPPLAYATDYIRNSLGNMKKFTKSDFQMGYGMRELIRRFYCSITDGGGPPIPYAEILRTAWIMDEIFSQLMGAGSGDRPYRLPAAHCH